MASTKLNTLQVPILAKIDFFSRPRSTLKKESYKAKLRTPRPLCLCGQSFLRSFGCGSAALGAMW
jgi:hypothetical protein